MTTPPSFENSYSPASDWSTTTTPKTQSVTTASGNDVILVLGGTSDSSTTLGTPTDGTNTYALQQDSLVASTCGAYTWSTGGPAGQLAVTTASLPAATVSTPYSAGLAATGGTGTGYTWSITSGALPSWATLTASTGVISGTPNAAATASFTVQVQDSGGNKASKPLSITTSSGSTSPVGPGGTWTLVFEDQFPGTSLNPANWTALEGASINGMTTHASNVSVSGGYCRLQLASSSSGATINSNPSNDGYGSGASGPVLAVGDCCEAYINFPGASGDSAYNWPAWWAAGGSWPQNGEEDIFEAFISTPSALNYHSPSGSNNGPNPSGSWCNSFHTYTLVRGSGTNGLKCYWDGVLVRSVTPSDSGGPQSLLITVGNGGDNNSYGSAGAALVKYVRMWTPG